MRYIVVALTLALASCEEAPDSVAYELREHGIRVEVAQETSDCQRYADTLHHQEVTRREMAYTGFVPGEACMVGVRMVYLDNEELVFEYYLIGPSHEHEWRRVY